MIGIWILSLKGLNTIPLKNSIFRTSYGNRRHSFFLLGKRLQRIAPDFFGTMSGKRGPDFRRDTPKVLQKNRRLKMD